MDGAYVGKLIYRFKVEGDLQFMDPPPLDWETPVFTMHLEGDVATLEMKEHYSTDREARIRAEEYLRAWEIDVTLKTGGRIRLDFERADILDSGPGVATMVFDVIVKDYVLVADAGSYTVHGSPVGLAVQRKTYPQPPTNFRATPLVETLWIHLNAFLEGRERLTDMGYFCVTALTAATGGDDKQAAQRFGISREVIRTLRKLSSEIGTRETVRKVTPRTQFRPHTPREEEWIKSAIIALVRRVGEEAAGAALPEITMTDLPR